MALTRDDIQALRRATSVIFIGFGDRDEGLCRATIERRTDALTLAEARIFHQHFHNDTWMRPIPIRAHVTRNLHGMGLPDPLTRDEHMLKASVLISSSHFDHAWQTIAKHFREGDELEVKFKADWHTSKPLAQDGWHHDVAYLRTYHDEGRRHALAHEFLLGSQVSKDDGLRMIAPMSKHERVEDWMRELEPA